MNKNSRYFLDSDHGKTVVRKDDDNIHLYYISEHRPHWKMTEYDHPYERELYFGQGYNCLSPISYEEAMELLVSWGVEISVSL